MSAATPLSTLPAVPPEVLDFAAQQGVGDYLDSVVEMTRRLFVGRPLKVLLESDPEIANDWHIVVEADTKGMTPEQIFAATTCWTEEIFQICPSTHACIFRCGLGMDA